MLVRLPATAAAGCCVSPPEQLSENFIYRILKSYAKENMGQCESKERDFKD
jgi:hypothetical protein